MRGNKIRGLCWLIRYNAQTLPYFVYWYQCDIFRNIRERFLRFFAFTGVAWLSSVLV